MKHQCIMCTTDVDLDKLTCVCEECLKKELKVN